MKTSCPHCGQHYEADDDVTRQQITCEACGQDFVIDSPVYDGIDAQTAVNTPTMPTWQDIWAIRYWLRMVLAVIFVVVAFYQMFDIVDTMERANRFEDSTLRATTSASQSMVYMGRAIMFMLLAFFVKPDSKYEK